MPESFDQSYLDYQVNRSALRRWVRQAYLTRAAALAPGRCIDFGCGAGELLARLGTDSVCLEYNHAAVAFCRSKGLEVGFYDGFADDWQLDQLQGQRFDTLVVSHVLEHLDDPMRILHRLLSACDRLGIHRVLVIVPQEAGYKVDATHRTFVELPMLEAAVAEAPGWRLATHSYFPFGLPVVGRVFAYNELQVVIERVSARKA